MCAMAMSLATFAQKGESRVGLNLNISPCMESGASLTNFGLAAKYQYGLTDHFRLEGVIGYDFKAKGVGVFEVGANVHYLFKIGEKMKIYPIAGIGYANVSGIVSFDEAEYNAAKDNYNAAKDNYNKFYGQATGSYDDEDDEIDGKSLSKSQSKFYYNLGAGFEYDFTNRLSASVELKWQGMKWFNRLPISIGVSYKF